MKRIFTVLLKFCYLKRVSCGSVLYVNCVEMKSIHAFFQNLPVQDVVG